MKLSIALALSASLAAAHPWTTRQADKKAPFLEPDTVFETCGKPKAAGDQTDQSEFCVGTVRYCREGLYKLFDEPFKTEQECRDSREAAARKKPFKEPAPGSLDLCGNGKFAGNDLENSEGCVGTIAYCSKGLYREFGEKFASEEACRASRDAAPESAPPVNKATKPFLQPNDSLETCGNERNPGDPRFESEPCVGTAVYCSKGFYEKFDEKFADEQECLSSRAKDPAAGAPTDTTPTPPTDESPADGSATPPAASEVPPAGDEDLPVCEE